MTGARQSQTDEQLRDDGVAATLAAGRCADEPVPKGSRRVRRERHSRKRSLRSFRRSLRNWRRHDEPHSAAASARHMTNALRGLS